MYYITRLLLTCVCVNFIAGLEQNNKSDISYDFEHHSSKKYDAGVQEFNIKEDNASEPVNTNLLYPDYWQDDSPFEETARFAAISPEFYASTFGNSLLSIYTASVLFRNSSTIAAAPIVLTVSLLAAFGAGVGALLGIVLVPIQIANQILAIIALALVVAFIIEEASIYKYLKKNYFGGDYEDETYYAVQPISYPQDYGRREGQEDPGEDEALTAQDWSPAGGSTSPPSSVATSGQRNRIDEAARQVYSALNKYDHRNQYKALAHKKFRGSEPDKYFSQMFS
ncbi:uncharacterized protein LOC108675685 [Hyalella azteca]|uniref:Uncharacterized protein LOC108675685 n=1 Tax=Hyalella azteca TaxID=294128 RepID=A0A8B7NZK2_HYAAZ|nr:uncharacterized protein LOC108675685 [Hyalella azteca]